MPYTVRPYGNDQKCPDGFTCDGWRQIHKGGYVRFVHSRYYHEDLAQWEGMWVFVSLHDWLAIEVEVWIGGAWEGVPLIASMESDEDRAKRKKPVKIG